MEDNNIIANEYEITYYNDVDIDNAFLHKKSYFELTKYLENLFQEQRRKLIAKNTSSAEYSDDKIEKIIATIDKKMPQIFTKYIDGAKYSMSSMFLMRNHTFDIKHIEKNVFDVIFSVNNTGSCYFTIFLEFDKDCVDTAYLYDSRCKKIMVFDKENLKEFAHYLCSGPKIICYDENDNYFEAIKNIKWPNGFEIVKNDDGPIKNNNKLSKNNEESESDESEEMTDEEMTDEEMTDESDDSSSDSYGEQKLISSKKQTKFKNDEEYARYLQNMEYKKHGMTNMIDNNVGKNDSQKSNEKCSKNDTQKLSEKCSKNDTQKLSEKCSKNDTQKLSEKCSKNDTQKISENELSNATEKMGEKRTIYQTADKFMVENNISNLFDVINLYELIKNETKKESKLDKLIKFNGNIDINSYDDEDEKYRKLVVEIARLYILFNKNKLKIPIK